jgi:hypothetical protein
MNQKLDPVVHDRRSHPAGGKSTVKNRKSAPPAEASGAALHVPYIMCSASRAGLLFRLLYVLIAASEVR